MRLALVVAVACLAPLVACGGKRPPDVGNADARLAPCPASPNCVSSASDGAEHRVAPLALVLAPDAAWPAIREEVARLPGTRIVAERAGYLHAESTSALLRFVDDLELRLRAGGRVVDVRSGSRVGRSDLGVNRQRVERLREALRARGVVEPGPG